jgi:hypothetical protein
MSNAFLIGLTLVLIGCRSPVPNHTAGAERPTLPSDTNTVISVSERPTMFTVVSKTSGRHIVPGIDIYADGRCLIHRFDGTESEKRVAPSELSELLRFLDQSGFFGMSNFLIDSKVKAAQLLPGGGIRMRSVTDANYILIFARTISKTNRIERYALDKELEWYPEIAELKAMRDAFRRVHEVVGETRRW